MQRAWQVLRNIVRAQVENSHQHAYRLFADELLERAVELDPAHHCLFLRAGLQEANRATSIHYARLAILHGQDDAAAQTPAKAASE
ncbi:hypothetical protein [Rhizobium etli]|uniref:Uncharacterized protein n=1 Tax=Rhizobium etli TaxID=29449 RepID=A0A7W6YA26_RHIET|nr:hypothetical protein [Rhizobium etli]MBB4538404.1 hypothetical protein [Rhizobium etli]